MKSALLNRKAWAKHYSCFLLVAAGLFGCSVAKKSPPVVRVAPSEETPSPQPTVEPLPFIFGSFVNTGGSTLYGPSWVEVIRWTLLIENEQAIFGSVCEFSGQNAEIITVSATSRIEIYPERRELRVLENKVAHASKGTRSCSAQTLPGVYRFEQHGDVLRLEHNDGATLYFFKKETARTDRRYKRPSIRPKG